MASLRATNALAGSAVSDIAIELADLETLKAMSRGVGPFASVMVRKPIPYEPQEVDTEWGSVRHQLRMCGAGDSTVSRIERIVKDTGATGHPLYVVSSADALGWRLLSGRATSGADDPSFGLVDQLPALAPVIDDLDAGRAVVGVVVDRAGVDILAMGSSGVLETTSVSGDRTFIHRVVSGGWSQRRRQARTDVAWERNASTFASHIRETAERLDADRIVLTGDDRQVALVARQLEPRSAERVEAGGRNEPATRDRLRQVLLEVARRQRDEDRTELFARIAEELGRADRAVEGPVATLDSLRSGDLETLVVRHDPADDRRAWFGDDPAEVSMFATSLSPAAGRSRLVDVAIRAALHTGASVAVAGPDDVVLSQGIGGLLRFRR